MHYVLFKKNTTAYFEPPDCNANNYNIYIKIPTDALGFMVVFLLHVSHHYATQLHPWNKSAFVRLLIYFIDLINARNMEDIKQCIYSKYILMMPSHLQL